MIRTRFFEIFNDLLNLRVQLKKSEVSRNLEHRIHHRVQVCCVQKEWAKAYDDLSQELMLVVLLYDFPKSRLRLAILSVGSYEEVSATVNHEDDVKDDESANVVP